MKNGLSVPERPPGEAVGQQAGPTFHRYLVRAVLTAEGLKNLQKQPPTALKAGVAKFVESVGGKLEFWYFDYGAATAYSVIDYPDEVAAATAQLSANAAGSLASMALADDPKLATESYMIPSADPGIQLYIRNKHLAGVTSFTGDKILLYVHGATYPSETAFDLPLGGRSMMDYIALQGWDVYLFDVRGYGGSTRPPEMEQPASENKPIADTVTAVRDAGSAINHILQKRGVAKINLMGWSWGTAIMGMYTAEHNDKVNRLVLYAPLWIFSTRPIIGGDGPLGAYRTVSKDSARQRWLTGVADDKQADLIPPGWFEQWADATWATDPESSKQTPSMLRAPNGVLQDLRTYWAAGKAQYDPSNIKVPTLIIHAEWDADLPSGQAHAYFAKLTNVPYKRFVEIGEGTHTIMMEKNRMQFFRELMNFLNESDPLALN